MNRSLPTAVAAVLSLGLFAQSGASVRVLYAPNCDTVITRAQIAALPVHQATIGSHDGEQATYEGALLWEVLALACPAVEETPKRERVAMAVRIGAGDGYTALVALTEADTSFRARPVLLCWRRNGQVLDDHNGPFQLIVPDDQRHARDVRQVAQLTVLAP